VGRAHGFGSPQILTSDDGLTWTGVAAGPEYGYGWLAAVAWSGAQFVAVGASEVDPQGALTLTSPDGTTWTQHAGALQFVPVDITWTGSMFVAVGGARATTSFDGLSWTVSSTGAQDLRGVASSGSNIVAVGSGAFTSPDAVTWTPSGGELGLQGITWSGAQYVAVGFAGTILTSP
jgi:hypothetical protein